MEATKISEMPIIPEEYGLDIYNNVNWSDVDSEMADGERRFINGLIQYYKPKSVLEIGVAAGGGTINLLNSAISAVKDCVVYSVDKSTQYYRKPVLPVGHYAIEKYPDLLDKNWRLITGKDPAEAMELINHKFDFCVLDTLHLHPIEILNFISVLPWLNDGAVVVIHDTTVFTIRLEGYYLRMFAPRLLLSSVCADKLIPNVQGWNLEYPNIAACQINAETRKYCQNLFDVLYMPWETAIEQTLFFSLSELIEKYYSSKQLDYFHEAVKMNKNFIFAKKYNCPNIKYVSGKISDDAIFYGAGAMMGEILLDFAFAEIDFSYKIWDINAEAIKAINGHAVTQPNFSMPARMGQALIVTIENKRVADQICEQFESLGYTVFHGLTNYLLSL